VRHIRIALLESGLPCAFVETDAAASATLSPTQKVPFLKYTENEQEKHLSDSSAILKYIREKSGKTFFGDAKNTLADFDNFCMANTLLDASINLFYLEKDGVTPQSSVYMARQQSRLQTGLAELNKLHFSSSAPFSEAELRIACFLDWALYRKRLSLEGFPALQKLLADLRGYPHFVDTAPPTA
jgi:glutathione S-transferase